MSKIKSSKSMIGHFVVVCDVSEETVNDVQAIVQPLFPQIFQHMCANDYKIGFLDSGNASHAKECLLAAGFAVVSSTEWDIVHVSGPLSCAAILECFYPEELPFVFVQSDNKSKTYKVATSDELAKHLLVFCAEHAWTVVDHLFDRKFSDFYTCEQGNNPCDSFGMSIEDQSLFFCTMSRSSTMDACRTACAATTRSRPPVVTKQSCPSWNGVDVLDLPELPLDSPKYRIYSKNVMLEHYGFFLSYVKQSYGDPVGYCQGPVPTELVGFKVVSAPNQRRTNKKLRQTMPAMKSQTDTNKDWGRRGSQPPPPSLPLPLPKAYGSSGLNASYSSAQSEVESVVPKDVRLLPMPEKPPVDRSLLKDYSFSRDSTPQKLAAKMRNSMRNYTDDYSTIKSVDSAMKSMDSATLGNSMTMTSHTEDSKMDFNNETVDVQSSESMQSIPDTKLPFLQLNNLKDARTTIKGSTYPKTHFEENFYTRPPGFSPMTPGTEMKHYFVNIADMPAFKSDPNPKGARSQKAIRFAKLLCNVLDCEVLLREANEINCTKGIKVTDVENAWSRHCLVEKISFFSNLWKNTGESLHEYIYRMPEVWTTTCSEAVYVRGNPSYKGQCDDRQIRRMIVDNLAKHKLDPRRDFEDDDATTTDSPDKN